MTSECTLRIAGEDDLPELLKLWTSVLHPDPSVFTSQYEASPPEKRPCFIAEADGRVVSSVQLFVLPVRDEHLQTIEIGALANVSTLPEYRLQGLSTSLLLQAIKRMGVMRCAWSFLFTGVAPFYDRLGWRIIHRAFPSVYLNAKSLPECSGSIHLQTPADVPALRELIGRCPTTPLSQVRSDLDWERKIPPRMQNRVLLVGKDCFAILRVADQRAKLEEWGMVSSSIDKYYDLLVAASRWAIDQGLSRLMISAPISPEARQALETLFMQVDDIDEMDAMVRPISEEWPMARLVALFAQPESRFLRLDNF